VNLQLGSTERGLSERSAQLAAAEHLHLQEQQARLALQAQVNSATQHTIHHSSAQFINTAHA
jgi:hypothetical protein